MTLLLVGTKERSADPSIYGEDQTRWTRACSSGAGTMAECPLIRAFKAYVKARKFLCGKCPVAHGHTTPFRPLILP
jgi:hypothetical protein